MSTGLLTTSLTRCFCQCFNSVTLDTSSSQAVAVFDGMLDKFRQGTVRFDRVICQPLIQCVRNLDGTTVLDAGIFQVYPCNFVAWIAFNVDGSGHSASYLYCVVQLEQCHKYFTFSIHSDTAARNCYLAREET